MLYETSKLNTIQLAMYMEHLHLCKQQHLECVNIPEIVNNFLQLCLVFHFFEMFCTNRLLINDHLVASKSCC